MYQQSTQFARQGRRAQQLQLRWDMQSPPQERQPETAYIELGTVRSGGTLISGALQHNCTPTKRILCHVCIVVNEQMMADMPAGSSRGSAGGHAVHS